MSTSWPPFDEMFGKGAGVPPRCDYDPTKRPDWTNVPDFVIGFLSLPIPQAEGLSQSLASATGENIQTARNNSAPALRSDTSLASSLERPTSDKSPNSVLAPWNSSRQTRVAGGAVGAELGFQSAISEFTPHEFYDDTLMYIPSHTTPSRLRTSSVSRIVGGNPGKDMEITVRPLGIHYGDCGAVALTVDFDAQSNGIRPKHGWIVQHIMFRVQVYTCRNDKIHDFFKEYWEAFEIENGVGPDRASYEPLAAHPTKVNSQGIPFPDSTVAAITRHADFGEGNKAYAATGVDTFNTGWVAGQDDTCGRILEAGELFWFDELPQPEVQKWRPGRVSEAGNLPAVDECPIDLVRARPATIRSLTVAWACCPKRKFTFVEAYSASLNSVGVGDKWSYSKGLPTVADHDTKGPVDVKKVKKIMDAMKW